MLKEVRNSGGFTVILLIPKYITKKKQSNSVANRTLRITKRKAMVIRILYFKTKPVKKRRK